MSQNRQQPKLQHARPAIEARTQAEAYDSLFANRELALNDGTVMSIPPHPDFGMLDDERTEAYEELLFEVDTIYDREPDIYIPEQRLRDPETGNETGRVIPEETVRGALKRPFRINGELVKPPYSIRVVQAALGELEYKRLKEGGRSAADVWKIWGQQGLEVKERQALDSKSNGSPVDVAPVSPRNR